MTDIGATGPATQPAAALGARGEQTRRSRTTSDRQRATIGLGWAAAIFLLALTLRLVYLAETLDSPLVRATYVDTQWHADWARAVADGEVVQDRPFFRAPLYPLFLGAALRLTGSFVGSRILQHVLGAASCVLVACLGARACGPGVGRIAGMTCALYGPLMYFENELLIPSLAVFLLSSCLLVLVRAIDGGGHGTWFIAGALLGLCAICRPNFLVLLFVVVPLGLGGGDAGVAARLRRSAWLVLGTVLAIAPVTAHNVVYGGEWVLISSQGGVNFWIGNHALADGRTAVAPGSQLSRMDAYVDNVWAASRAVAESESGGTLSDGAVSRFWWRRGLRFWRDQPGSAVALALRKAYYFSNGFEIESNRSLYLDRQWSWLCAVLVWDLGLAFPGGLLWPLAVLGACLPGPHRRVWQMLRGVAGLYALTVVAFFVTARFRIPLVPLGAIFAAHAVVCMVDRVRAGRAATVRPWGVLLAVALALSNSAWWDVRRIDLARQAGIVASAWVQLGAYERAVLAYRQALAIDPQRYAERYNLALALRSAGRLHAAVDEMAAALRLSPRDADAHNEHGNLLAEAGRLPEAIAAYGRATTLAPDLAMAWANLGLTLIDAKRFQDARDALRRALALARKATYHFAVGLAERGLEDSSSALSSLRRALVLDPTLVAAQLELGVTCHEAGDAAAAEQAFQAALVIDDTLAEPWMWRGVLRAESGDAQAAAKMFQQALRRDPRLAPAHCLMARTLDELGDAGGAARHRQAATALGLHCVP